MNKLYNDTAVQAIANAIRTKNGSSDTYTIAEMSTALNDLSYYAKPTISNVPLATFEADGLPLNSLKVSVEAKQDLHGYDKPWVGGAGKNKFSSGNMHDTTLNNVSFTLNDDGSVKVNGTASATTSVYFFGGSSTYEDIKIPSGDYIVSGGTENVCFYLVRMRNGETESLQVYRTEKALNIQDGDTFRVFLRVANGATASNEVAKPMIRLATETDPTFAPYSNICPISGWDEAKVSDVDDVDNPTVTQTTTIALGQTIYGAEVDVVNGVLTITHEYIASYNGETLPSTWISSMDVYAEGTTPTTGAEVCYERANPISTNLTPNLIKSLEGTNNLSVDCGEVIELEYFKEV